MFSNPNATHRLALDPVTGERKLVEVKPQAPAVGRIVHYVAAGMLEGTLYVGEHLAALITEVDPALKIVGLCIFTPIGLSFKRDVPFDETFAKPGAWHWPEKV